MIEDDRRSVVDIDINNLEEEWMRQPRIFLKFAEKLAEAKLEYSEAKAAIDVAKAEAGKDVRKYPKHYGIIKPSEKAYEAAVSASDEVQEATSKANKAKYRVDMLEAKVRSLEHRKTALENEVQLFLSSYYSAPRAPKGKREQVEEMEKHRVRKPLGRDDDG